MIPAMPARPKARVQLANAQRQINFVLIVLVSVKIAFIIAFCA